MATRCAALCCVTLAIFGLPCGAAEGAADDEAVLRRAVIRAANEDTGTIVFYVDVMGRPSRARLLGADADGVEVSVAGNTMTLRWSQISPARFAGLGRKVVVRDAGLALPLALARYCADHGLARRAKEAVEMARAAGAEDSEIRAVSGETRPPAPGGRTAAQGRESGGRPAPSGGARVVEIHVRDHSGTTRKSWPVTGGVPLPKGKVRDVRKIGLAKAPSQARVLSRWSDGSIRWALLDYQTDLPAGGRAKHTVVLRGRAASSSGNRVRDDGGRIVVDTGVLKLSVSKSRFEFLGAVWLDLNGDGRYLAGEEIVRPGRGHDLFFDLQEKNPARPTVPYAARNLLKGTSRPVKGSRPTVEGGSRWIRPEGGGAERRVSARAGGYSAAVVEHGPLRTVVLLRGTFGPQRDGNEYSIRIHAYRGKPFLRVQHTFVFKGDPQKDNIRRMGLQLPLNFAAAPRFRGAGVPGAVQLGDGDIAYLFCTGPHDVFHLEHGGFPLDWEVGAGAARSWKGTRRTAGWIDVTGEAFGVTLSFRDMACMYPKELSYDAGRRALTAWLWPDHGKLVLDLRASGYPDGMQGVSFTHDVFYCFHPPDEGKKSAQIAAGLDDPLQPYADPIWYSYRGTRAAGMIMPHDDRQFPRTEAFLAARTAFLERSMTEFGWLGMLNYGDLLWAYKYNERGRPLGTWGMAAGADDYDGWRRGNTMISYRMFMQYLRTGEHGYWRAAEAHLRMVRDVLIKHYSTRHPKYNGLGRRHSAYWGAPGNAYPGGTAIDGYGTNWLGHYIHWNLTGDWRTLDVINEIRGAWNRLGNSAAAEISGGAYVGLKLTGGIPGCEKARTEADAFLKTAVERTSKPGDLWRDCTWFFGYGLYLADVRDEKVRRAILDWWKRHPGGPDKYGMYWNRDAVAAVYWAAEGNREIRRAAYEELLKHCTESRKLRGGMQAIYRKHGVEGLFRCDFRSLARSAVPSAWRAKDDIMQLQWDEPLVMAVIDHYRRQGK